MEYESVESHPAIRMTRFYMKSIGMWYVEKRSDKIISNVVLSYTVLTMATAVAIMAMDFYYCLGDLHAIAYNAPCVVTVVIEFLKLMMFLYNRRKVMDLNAFTENTFWKIKYEAEDLLTLNQCNQQTMRVSTILTILLQLIAWHYLSIPITESIGKNASDRILPFKLWLDLPVLETPYYQIAFGIEAAAAISVAICATTFAQFLFTICIYATGQFKILQRRLENCCDAYTENILAGNIQKNAEYATFSDLKDCIIQHQMLIQYMDRVENLYCYIMLGEALGAVLQICFSGFQVLLGAEESIPRAALSVEFLGGCSIILYLFAWACHEIILASTAVAEAAYRGAWYNLSHNKWGYAYRAAVIIVIARARKPCILTVGKFTPMSLETFTSVLSTAISYFTILRQMNEES